MKNIQEIKTSLINLINRDLSDKVVDIKPLPVSGSSRIYFRINTIKRCYIGTYNSNIEENTAFFSFSEHFKKCGLPVPTIIAINQDKTCYIQEDLGDTTLFTLVQDGIKNSHFSDAVIDYYKKSLEYLIDFQINGHKNLDYSIAFPTSSFDRLSVLDDLNYFKYYFLKLHPDLVFNETKLNLDFQKLTDFILEAQSDFFMYRDFQSRNIMIKDNNIYFIDYQGGRKGPLQYDVVSLLYQVKAQLPQNMRNTLLQHYKDKLSRYLDINQLQFDKYYQAFVLLRLMQVLGAYGFRGLIQKKRHFMESIQYALKELLKQNANLTLPFDLPELSSVFNQLSDLIPLYQHVENEVLTITVNSFSYKNGGIPEDTTGNCGGFVFDCRALPNPGRLECFRHKTGIDQEVQDFLNDKQEVHNFMEWTEHLITQAVENYIERGFKNLSVSFGCTGGQHRSVFFVQKISETLHLHYPQIRIIVNHLAQHKSFTYDPR